MKNEAPATKQELLQAQNDKIACAVCSRPLGLINVDRHHLTPKSRGGKDQYFIHKICHRKIHATFTEKQLEKEFDNWQAIVAHPEIQKFIQWVQKKPAQYYDCSISSNEKKKKR